MTSRSEFEEFTESVIDDTWERRIRNLLQIFLDQEMTAKKVQHELINALGVNAPE